MRSKQDSFLAAAEAWLCDGYGIDIRYVAIISDGELKLCAAMVGLVPRKPDVQGSFRITTNHVIAGQIQRHSLNKTDLMRVLREAVDGRLDLGDSILSLSSDSPLSYYSESGTRDKWFSDLHLQVAGGRAPVFSLDQNVAIDNELRSATPPFDGTPDLLIWLGLDANALNGSECTVIIRLLPPVIAMLNGCSFQDGTLTLAFETHQAFDTTRVRVAVRGAPGGLEARLQAADRIVWSENDQGGRFGGVRDGALMMLMIGQSVVQRHWFNDPTKARNRRLLAFRAFDPSLKKVQAACQLNGDGRDFEKGVVALLFLLGFSPALCVATDAPDIVVTTPGGQLAIVECTTRIGDFQNKVGKLTDRRGVLQRAMSNSGHPADVIAVLVSCQARDQVPVDEKFLRDTKIKLLCREDIERGLHAISNPPDPDELLMRLRNELDAFNFV